MNYKIVYTKQAEKDFEKVKTQPALLSSVKKLVAKLRENPFSPPYERLVGDLNGYYSRRINIQHRLVYQVIEAEQTVKVLRMWTHYD